MSRQNVIMIQIKELPEMIKKIIDENLKIFKNYDYYNNYNVNVFTTGF